MKFLFRTLAALAAFAPFAAQATPTQTPSGYITMLEGGWTGAYMRVQTDFSFTNPENCPWVDGYLVDPADSGNVLFSSMLMSAYMAHRKVQFTIDGCNGRPHIISVVVYPN